MPVKLGAGPEHDFDQPLGLLSDCHRRIENFLGVLLKVADDAAGQPLTASQREAIEVSLRYFSVAAPRHTQDEENSLFPRMRHSQDLDVRTAMAKIDALEADHRRADAAHAEVDDLARRWLNNGSLDPAETSRLTDVLKRLRMLYQEHIQIEDKEIFPLAGRVLSSDEIATIGREMAGRRGLGHHATGAAGQGE